jgi:GT2 family glycosyltransferase
MMNFAVIIVNYKNEEQTINYVNSELCKLSEEFMLIIVNNSANDYSDKLLSKKLNAKIIDSSLKEFIPDISRYIISSNGNLGFAKGNNLGVALAAKKVDIKYLLFSNNDIKIISKDTVSQLICKIDSNPEIGIIGPDCVDINNISQSPWPYIPFFKKFIFSYWITFFMSKRKKVKVMGFDYPKNAVEGFHYKLSGSFFLTRKEDYIKCGMMDPNTFLYCEEEILTERMAKISKKPYYLPSVKIVHEQSQTISKYYNARKKMLLDFQSNAYYYGKYKGVKPIFIKLGFFNHFMFFSLKFLFKRFRKC